MKQRPSLSVVIITLDEEKNLERCLRSVSWAEEIVVVDAGSSDRTVEIARRHGARVIEQPWLGYAGQKNLGLERATRDWVLCLDADEWLTAEGAEEMRAALVRPRARAFAVNRLTAFSGAFLRRAWSPDWQVRLFRRECGRFGGGLVHESVVLAPSTEVERLRCRLPHLGYRSLAGYVERMNRYTDLAAETLDAERRPVPWVRMLVSPPATFLKLFVLKGGFLDGVRGLVVSAGSAYYVLLKYAKLWERRRPADPAFRRRVGETAEDPRPDQR
jgi:glycosyltransferase involved in cell wall biosynthesis